MSNYNASIISPNSHSIVPAQEPEKHQKSFKATDGRRYQLESPHVCLKKFGFDSRTTLKNALGQSLKVVGIEKIGQKLWVKNPSLKIVFALDNISTSQDLRREGYSWKTPILEQEKKELVVDDSRVTCNRVANFYESYKQQLDCDVIFKVEGKQFGAHACWLKANSVFFKGLLSGNFKEKRSEENVIEIKEIDAETFEMFLEYLYSSKISITQENILSIAGAANSFSEANLRGYCERLLPKFLTHETALTYLQELIGVDSFLNPIVENYFYKHLPEILKEDEETFLSLSKEALFSLFEKAPERFKKNFFQVMIIWIFKSNSDSKVQEWITKIFSWLPKDEVSLDDYSSQLKDWIQLPESRDKAEKFISTSKIPALTAIYAKALLSLGQYELAEAAFKEALHSDPNNAFTLEGYGELLLEMGESKLAFEKLKAALSFSLNPKTDLKLILEDIEQINSGQRNAFFFPPTPGYLDLNLIKGEYKIPLITKLKVHKSLVFSTLFEKNSTKHTKFFADLLKDFKQWLKQEPSNIYALINYPYILKSLGQYELAKEKYEEFLKLMPNNACALKNFKELTELINQQKNAIDGFKN